MIGRTLYFRHINPTAFFIPPAVLLQMFKQADALGLVFDPCPAGMAMEDSAGAAARPVFRQMGDKELKLAAGKQQARIGLVTLESRSTERNYWPGKLRRPGKSSRSLKRLHVPRSHGLELARSYNPLRGGPLRRTWIR
ncbi:MAG: hypothetical protein JO271_04265 [Verrucomicrobia bacterium]|nr:hypothetical protein [Verrucomicrobiota bacterium]